MAKTRSREKHSVTIIGAVAAWVLANMEENGYVLLLVSLIPVTTTIFFGYSVYLLYKNIRWIGEYLKHAEGFLYKNVEQFGWEKFLDDRNKESKFVALTRRMWFAQLIISLVLITVVLKLKY